MTKLLLPLVASISLGNFAFARDHRSDFMIMRQQNRIENQKKEIKKQETQVACDKTKKDQECCDVKIDANGEKQPSTDPNC